jgi:hypothetical protein
LDLSTCQDFRSFEDFGSLIYNLPGKDVGGKKEMSRTFKDIQIDGKNAFALFDTGSIRSYVRKEFASQVKQRTTPFIVGLGGGTFEINESCLLNCAIEGLPFDIKAHPVKEIGTDEPNFSFKKKSPPYQRGLGGCIKRNTKEKRRQIDAIIGAVAMEEWGFILDPRTGSIDLTVLRKREFIEF